MRNVSASTWARLALFTTLAVVAKWFWLSSAGAMIDYRDAQYNSLFEDAARISLVRYHELPLWNPFYCGGIYGLGTPSARFSSPTILISIIFGALRASPIIAVLACIAGLEGTYRYARSHQAGTLGAMLAAPLFALCGFFPRSGAFEWINFLGFELLPWAALGLRHAFGGGPNARRSAVMAGVAVGWMTCFGGTYAAPYALLVGLLELAQALVRFRKNRAQLASMITMGAIAALLGAGIASLRLWPIAETLAASPRVLGEMDSNGPLEIAKALFGAKIPFRGDFLVGVLVLPFALIAAFERRNLGLFVSAAFFLWLATGYGAHPSAYAMLRTIPPYTMLRSPERFLVPFALFYAVLAARGFGRFEAIVRKKLSPRRSASRSSIVVAMMTLACINDGVLADNDWAWQRGRVLLAAPDNTGGEREFANARGNRWLAAYYPGMNRGTLSCFDDYQVPQSPALRGDLPHEEFLSDTAAGKVTRTKWTPNTITLHADLTKPARVIVNQNWHPGWHASVGAVVADEERLAVDLPAGAHDVVLRFLPRSAVGGILTALLACAACVALWRVRRLKTLAALGIAAAPFLGVVVAFAFVSEPKRPPRRLVLPNGDPIAQAEPPDGAQHLGVDFEDGVTLDSARIVLNRSGNNAPTLDFELDWRLAHAAPPGLGIFVHLEPDKGDTVNVDHVGLATVAPFEAFPANMILRDSLPGIGVENGKTYKVFAGVWRARGGGERLHVIAKGAATVEDDQILVTTIKVP